jgi:hypothetical protein
VSSNVSSFGTVCFLSGFLFSSDPFVFI